MSNLRLINETSITSSVSSVNVEDVFTDDFDIYKITSTGVSTTAPNIFSKIMGLFFLKLLQKVILLLRN